MIIALLCLSTLWGAVNSFRLHTTSRFRIRLSISGVETVAELNPPEALPEGDVSQTKVGGQLMTDTAQKNPESGAYNFDMWAKAFESQIEEFDYTLSLDDIEGEIPADFTSGTLFRMMPSRFERGNVSYGHYLDGDGYAVKLSIDCSNTLNPPQIQFQSKFVKTAEFVAEERAGKILSRSTFRTQKEASGWSMKLSGGTLDTNNAFDLKLKNLANTNVVYWGGKLMALFEAGIPIELHPQTLDTIGPCDLGIGSVLNEGLPVLVPKLKRQLPFIHDRIFGQYCTAHPKIDPVRGIMALWTWQACAELDGVPSSGPLDSRPILHFREFDSLYTAQPIVQRAGASGEGCDQNRLDLEASVCESEGASASASIVLKDTSVAPHDFSITPSHYVVVENRLSGSTLPYILGEKCPAEVVNLEPNRDMLLHLVPRPQPQNEKKGDALRMVVPLSSGFTIHSVAAWEGNSNGDGDYDCDGRMGKTTTVELLTSAWACKDVAGGTASGGLLGNWEGRAPNFDSIPRTLLYHTVVDKDTGKLISHAPLQGMEQIIIEHPHINPEREGRPVRYVYMSLGSKTGMSSPPVGYLRVDMATGERQEWYAPLHTYCEEVVVVPKKKKEKQQQGEDEDDVYLLCAMFDAVREKSCVGLFDGKRVHEGPLCRMWLKHQLPHSLHGTFVPQLFK
jgi:all-trans-8'-apo-beta-carotenal 15,15'-oxygenase